jgi:hypothetical protein
MKRWITRIACVGIIATLALTEAGCARFAGTSSTTGPDRDYPSASPSSSFDSGRPAFPAAPESP